MSVTSPITGEFLGKIKQKWHFYLPIFEIYDAQDNHVLSVKGPFCTISMCGDVSFDVMTVDGNEIGKVTKQWSGFIKEAMTDADNFGITFPLDLDVKLKATLLGLVFLIDFMYFEEAPDRDN